MSSKNRTEETQINVNAGTVATLNTKIGETVSPNSKTGRENESITKTNTSSSNTGSNRDASSITIRDVHSSANTKTKRKVPSETKGDVSSNTKTLGFLPNTMNEEDELLITRYGEDMSHSSESRAEMPPSPRNGRNAPPKTKIGENAASNNKQNTSPGPKTGGNVSTSTKTGKESLSITRTEKESPHNTKTKHKDSSNSKTRREKHQKTNTEEDVLSNSNTDGEDLSTSRIHKKSSPKSKVLRESTLDTRTQGKAMSATQTQEGDLSNSAKKRGALSAHKSDRTSSCNNRTELETPLITKTKGETLSITKTKELLPMTKTKGEPLHNTKTKGELLPITKTNGEPLPITRTKGEPLPITKTKGEALPITKTKGDLLPITKTKGQPLPITKTKGEPTSIIKSSRNSSLVTAQNIGSVETNVKNQSLLPGKKRQTDQDVKKSEEPEGRKRHEKNISSQIKEEKALVGQKSDLKNKRKDQNVTVTEESTKKGTDIDSHGKRGGRYKMKEKRASSSDSSSTEEPMVVNVNPPARQEQPSENSTSTESESEEKARTSDEESSSSNSSEIEETREIQSRSSGGPQGANEGSSHDESESSSESSDNDGSMKEGSMEQSEEQEGEEEGDSEEQEEEEQGEISEDEEEEKEVENGEDKREEEKTVDKSETDAEREEDKDDDVETEDETSSNGQEDMSRETETDQSPKNSSSSEDESDEQSEGERELEKNKPINPQAAQVTTPIRRPLPSGVKAKLLHIKVVTASLESQSSAQSGTSVRKRCQRSSVRQESSREIKPNIPTNQSRVFTAQTHIITNLRRRQREAREHLLSRSKEDQITNSNETTHEEERCPEKEYNLEEQQSINSTVSSSSSKTKKPAKKEGRNTSHGEDKVGETVHENDKENSETDGEREKKREQEGGKSLSLEDTSVTQKDAKMACSMSAFRRVTGWLRRAPQKRSNLKERVASVARTIGITDWLCRTFREKKKNRQCELKRRTAMRILSTSKMVNRLPQAPPGLPSAVNTSGEQEEENIEPNSTNTEGDEVERAQQETYSPAQSVRKLSDLSEVEEAPGTGDAKYAIVFPRIHHLAKTIKISPAAQRTTHRTGQRVVASVQPATSRGHQRVISGGEEKENPRNHPNQPENMDPSFSPQYQSKQITDSRPKMEQVPEEEENNVSTINLPRLRPPRNIKVERTSTATQGQSTGGTAINDVPVDSSCASSPEGEEEESEPDLSFEATTHVHWAQNVPGRDDPTSWLSSETLLPQMTIENLSKWTIYHEIPHTTSVQPVQPPKDRWEAEDSAEDMLQLAIKKKQTSVGHMLLSVNPFKPINIYSSDMALIYRDSKLVEKPPHIFAVVEEAYTLSQTSECAPNILLSGHGGSGKTEAVRLISQYLMTLSRREGDKVSQLPEFLTVLESFGNAKTILHSKSTRFGQILQVFLHRGSVVGSSVSQYLLEKSRVVFQAAGERGFHVFYELLAGLPEHEKQGLYLQEPETYYYLNQGRACDLPEKNDRLDFLKLGTCLRAIGLIDTQMTAIWAILSAILQLGNICFTSCERDCLGFANDFSVTEIRIVASLLQISPEGLQRAITQRVTVTSYDQVLSPLSVEASIDARDAISQTLYSLLFDWLLEKGNDWLCPRKMDRTLHIIDICGFENLGVNSLEQLCRNFANEQIQYYTKQRLICQEQAEYAREGLHWVPLSTEGSGPCLGLLTEPPHGIFHILEEQSELAQATDHTFLQKCHYHHGHSSCYIKPKLPLPVFTLQHYAGAVTYQVHNFLNKNRDRLSLVAREVLSQTRLKLLSELLNRPSNFHQQKTSNTHGKCSESTLTGRFQLSLQDLTGRLERGHTLVIRCISPNPKKLPGIFDVEFVSSQLRNSGILEAVQIMKEGYPVRIQLKEFMRRYGHLVRKGNSFSDDKEICAAVLTKIFGDSSVLYQIGLSKVFLKEKGMEILRSRWEEMQSLAALTLQKNLRGFLNRKNFQVYRRKITVIQAHVRGHQARRRYRRLKHTRLQFGAVLLISRIPSIHKRICQVGESCHPLLAAAGLRTGATAQHVRSQVENTRITEVSPPQVKAQCTLSLPPDINNFPLSLFIRSYFKDPVLPPLGQPLPDPLTRVSRNDHGAALELYKLALRFVGDTTMPSWQQRIVGNYIAERCLRQPSLRDEVLCQVTSLTVQNDNDEQCQRAWLLLSALLGCLTPSPTLEKYLLKYVSDQGLEGYKAMCQHKVLRGGSQGQKSLEVLRCHAPTVLEWTASERRGKMVVDVYTYNEEKYTTELDSWTTGEQIAGWLLQSRGVGEMPRGWTVSILDGDQWFDLSGDDFLLDVIAEVEDGVPPNLDSTDFPFGDDGGIPEPPPDFAPLLPHGQPTFPPPGLAPGHPPPVPPPAPPPPPPPGPPPLDRSNSSIPPAPPLQAPSLPQGLQDQGRDDQYSSRIGGGLRGSQRMDNYLDQLFSPVLSSPADLDRAENLNWRMKGGGGIGPNRQGYTGMGSMPSYSMPMMNGMMPAMGNVPMIPAMPAMMPQAMMPQAMMPQAMMPQQMPMSQPMMPQPMPAVDPTQMAAQQQAFINQQALLLAQQMTLQATMLSQQQRERTQDPPRRIRESSPPPAPKPAPKPASKPTPAPALPAPAPPPSAPSPAPSAPAPPPAPSPSPASSPPAPSPKSKPEKPKREKITQVLWETEDEPEYSQQKRTFQQKREYFQQMASQEIKIKSLKPPSKILLPNPGAEKEESESDQDRDRDSDSDSDSDKEPPEPAEPEPQPDMPSPKPPAPPAPVAKKPETKDKIPKPGGVVKPAPKPQPSREIREIIMMYQNRPQPELKPFEPVRRPAQSFLKRKDPKQEALERLQMAGGPPPVAPKPPQDKPQSDMRNSLREKQKPLLQLFQPNFIPPPPDVQAPCLRSPTLEGRSLDGDNSMKSTLIKHTASVFFSYTDVNWRLYARKELFYPKEKFTHPYYLNLLCEQIIRDTFSDSGFRLTRDERKKMRDFLTEFHVGTDANSITEESIKKRIVIAARDNWENYFSRLFPVRLEDDSDFLLLGVSHRGIRLVKDVNAAGIQQRHLKTLCSYSFADILSLDMQGSRSLRFCLRTEEILLHSDKAKSAKVLVEMFMQELVKDSNHVIALRSYITDDKSLLQFKKGDIIKILPMDGLQPGWQFGSIGGRSGLFPSHMVQPAAAPDYYTVLERKVENKKEPRLLQRTISKESVPISDMSVATKTPSPPPFDAADYTMVEFALKYFREAQTMLGWKGMAAEGKKAVELVQYTKVPIQESLIHYADKELNEQATQNFMTLMRFMGDQQYREKDDVACVYEILQLCREKQALRDEIYCQVLKQITENPKHESCNRGWRILSLLTGFYIPSPTLLPYVTKYLQDCVGDYQEISRTCQEHLRHTVLYHGRRHLPVQREMEALLSGRVTRRLVVMLPGGVEYTTKIKTFTVAADLVPEICEQLNVSDPEEVEEFAIFANKSQGEVVRPLRGGDYIHDFLLADNSVSLEFRRVTWKATLRGRSELYVEVHYNQILRDYMQGKALLLSSVDLLGIQTGKVAAILHRIKGLSTPPSKQELMEYIPSSVHNRLNLQSVHQNLLQELRDTQNITVQQAKVCFLEIVTGLPLFEYNVFHIKRISEPGMTTPCFVAINHQHLLILENNSTQPHMSINLQDIQSMRTMRPLDSNTLPGVEIHYGSAANPRTLWMELQEAKELYHTLALIIEGQETLPH
ncbi:myosin XVB [Rhinophrynus dorsalis]